MIEYDCRCLRLLPLLQVSLVIAYDCLSCRCECHLVPPEGTRGPPEGTRVPPEGTRVPPESD